jgi:hypothetical protein
MPNLESPFGKRVEERAEAYKAKTKEFFNKMVERTKNALEFLKGAPFLVAALAMEGGIEAANRGKEAVREGVDAIKTGADKAMEFGRNKKEQALRLWQSIVEAGKTKVRDARDGLVNRVNEARGWFSERINQIKERRAQKQIDSIERAIDEHLRQIGKLLEEREKRRAYLRSSKERFQPYAA